MSQDLPQESLQIDRELLVQGLTCPLPILRTKKALSEMSSGSLLRVVATDRSTVNDFEAFTRQTGHQLLSREELGKEFVFIIRRK